MHHLDKKSNKPFFSIVIPLYNKAEYIIDTLNSVKKQTFKNFEIIIINDGSTDNSLKIANSYLDPKISVIDQKNQGVSTARNTGIEAAKGSYIAFLDADDYWYANHLELLHQSIIKYPNEAVFCTNYEIYITKKNVKKTTFSFSDGSNENIILVENYFKSSLINSIAWTSAVCLKKSIFRSSLLFDTNISSGQDTDLWIRLGLKYNFVFSKRITARHNQYIEKSLSKKNTIKSRHSFTLKYLTEEKEHIFLKKFIDNNRFAIALQCKERNERIIYNKLKNQIDYSNLNLKQKTLLATPAFLLVFLKKIKLFLFKRNINILLYK